NPRLIPGIIKLLHSHTLISNEVFVWTHLTPAVTPPRSRGFLLPDLFYNLLDLVGMSPHVFAGKYEPILRRQRAKVRMQEFQTGSVIFPKQSAQTFKHYLVFIDFPLRLFDTS